MARQRIVWWLLLELAAQKTEFDYMRVKAMVCPGIQ